MPEVVINGSAGRIEAHYYPSGGHMVNAPIALVLHTHPQKKGTMHHPITQYLFKAFSDMGFNVLRFNFRGVGRSQGVFSDGEGELADAASCLNWLQAHNPEPSSCWVAGFSFGAWIGMQLLMRRPELSGFISVAPPAHTYDFSFLAPCPVSGLIIHGEKDRVIPKECSEKLAQRLSLQKGIHIGCRTIEGADHLFKNSVSELTSVVQSYVTESMDTKAPAPKKRSAFGYPQAALLRIASGV